MDQLQMFPAPIDRIVINLSRSEHLGALDLYVATGRPVPFKNEREWEREWYEQLTVDEAADVLYVWLSVCAWGNA
jgi:hypothetical protein